MNKDVYLPNERTIYPRINQECKTDLDDGKTRYSTENIVVNNIAWQEFDYTEKIDYDQ